MDPSIVEYLLLPDGTYAGISRQMSYGEAVIIFLLVALVFLKVYELWRAR